MSFACKSIPSPVPRRCTKWLLSLFVIHRVSGCLVQADSFNISGKPRISCPVCSDTAVPHFHYGGMCCYSCKAFFRRVVNTYKVDNRYQGRCKGSTLRRYKKVSTLIMKIVDILYIFSVNTYNGSYKVSTLTRYILHIYLVLYYM